jgi:hypothetical protein
MSASAKSRPVAETPQATIKVFLCHPERSEGPRNRSVAEVFRFAQNDIRASQRSLFALTHAFLI